MADRTTGVYGRAYSRQGFLVYSHFEKLAKRRSPGIEVGAEAIEYEVRSKKAVLQPRSAALSLKHLR